MADARTLACQTGETEVSNINWKGNNLAADLDEQFIKDHGDWLADLDKRAGELGEQFEASRSVIKTTEDTLKDAREQHKALVKEAAPLYIEAADKVGYTKGPLPMLVKNLMEYWVGRGMSRGAMQKEVQRIRDERDPQRVKDREKAQADKAEAEKAEAPMFATLDDAARIAAAAAAFMQANSDGGAKMVGDVLTHTTQAHTILGALLALAQTAAPAPEAETVPAPKKKAS